MMFNKIFRKIKSKSVILGFLLALLVLSVPIVVLAADTWSYYVTISVTDTSGSARTGLPVLTGIAAQGLINAGYLDSDGNDTSMNEGSADIEYTVGTTNVGLYVEDLAAGQTRSYRFYMDNNPATAQDMIFGDNGYVTVSDAAALELGNNFEIEVDAYFNTAAGADKNIVNKDNAFRAYVSDATDIRVSFMDTEAVTYLGAYVDKNPGASGAWTDVDCSANIPATSTGVLLHIEHDDSGANDDFGLRMNGSGDARQAYDAANDSHFWAAIGVDGAQIFEVYMGDHLDYDIWLIGYFEGNATFIQNANDKSIGAGAWTNIDCSVQAPGATGLIFEVVGSTDDFGFRNDGSSDTLEEQVNNHTWYWVGCDAATQICEGYVDAATCDFFLVGYTTSGATYNVDADDKSLGATGSWIDIDCSTEAPGATALIFEVIDMDGFGSNYGLRENGSGEAIIWETECNNVAVIECDADQIVEGYISDLDIDFWLLGWIGGERLGVEVAGVTTGEHNIKFTSTGGTTNLLGIDVDSGTITNTVALGGLSVLDNANDWVIMGHATGDNTAIYTDYYKQTVGGTLITHYQPTTLISGTTLPDREGAAQNGTITWGSNTDITITIGAITSYEDTVSTASTDTSVSYELPTAGEPSGWFVTGTFAGALTPELKESFADAATDMGMPEQSLWVLIWFGVSIAVGLSVYLFTGSAIATLAVVIVLLWAGVNAAILDFGLVMLVIILGLGTLYLVKQH